MAGKSMETGLEFFARLTPKASLVGLENELFPDGPQQKEVFEFFGEEGTGKTEMLLHLIISCTFPKTWRNFKIHGLESQVILICTDYKFSILRLVFLMEKKIKEIIRKSGKKNRSDREKNSDALPSESETEIFVKSCLQRLHVIHCSSSTQLLLTLSGLDNKLAANPDISLLMIDSISSFYWFDRFLGNENQPFQRANMKKIIIALKFIINNFNLVVIATKLMIFKHKPNDFSITRNSCGDSHAGRDQQIIEHNDCLGRPWQEFVKEQFIFSKIPPCGRFQMFQITANFTKKFTVSESGIRFLGVEDKLV